MLRNLRSINFLYVSREALARKLKVSVFTVANWETKGTEPQPTHFRRLMALAKEVGYSQDLWPLKNSQIPRGLPVAVGSGIEEGRS
jgi:hypothetical protein